MSRVVWLTPFEHFFQLWLKLLHIVSEPHHNFCLNIIKIWSMPLCLLVRCSEWVAGLTCDEPMPPFPQAPAIQL